MVNFDENLNPIEGGGQPPRPEHYQAPEPERPIHHTPQPMPKLPQSGSGMPNMTSLILLVGIVAITAIALGQQWNSGSDNGMAGQPQGLTVTAEGRATGTPDVAKITYGVSATGTTVDKVKKDINTALDKIKAALKDADVKDADIKTVNYNIYPQYDTRIGGTQRITGYSGNHSQIVTVRDLDKANEILDLITNNGANDVSNIVFAIDNPDDVRQQARAEAIKKAKDQAKQIAKDADISLGRIISMNDYISSGAPSPYFDSGFGGKGGSEIGTSVEPGETEIVANVTIIYDIR